MTAPAAANLREQRRRLILRSPSSPSSRVHLNEHLEHPDGALVLAHACKMGVEGIVSKRLGSRYRSGRSPDWLPPAARSQQARNPTSRQPGGYAGRGQGRVRGELEAVEGVGGFGKSPKSAAVGWLGCGVGRFPFLAPPRRGAFCFSGGLRIVFRCFACLNQSWWGSPSNFQPRFTAGFSFGACRRCHPRYTSTVSDCAWLRATALA